MEILESGKLDRGVSSDHIISSSNEMMGIDDQTTLVLCHNKSQCCCPVRWIDKRVVGPAKRAATRPRIDLADIGGRRKLFAGAEFS
jgi:hypothetical protein